MDHFLISNDNDNALTMIATMALVQWLFLKVVVAMIVKVVAVQWLWQW